MNLKSFPEISVSIILYIYTYTKTITESTTMPGKNGWRKISKTCKDKYFTWYNNKLRQI